MQQLQKRTLNQWQRPRLLNAALDYCLVQGRVYRKIDAMAMEHLGAEAPISMNPCDLITLRSTNKYKIEITEVFNI